MNDYQKTYLTGLMEANSSLVEYKTSLENYTETKKRAQTDKRIYDLAKDKRQIGAGNDLDVLIAKEAYLLTKKEEASNKINIIISVIGLYKALGGVNLYEIENT